MTWARARRRALGVAAALLAGVAASARGDEAGAEPNAPPSEFSFELRAAGFYGPVDGYVQVPAGGNPGSSSSRRPTLHELGIDDAVSYEIDGRVWWGHLGFFAGYNALDMTGSSTLTQSLVSHNVLFPAGSPTKSTVDLDVPNFGAGWRFDFDDRRLELFPKINLVLLDFSYSLDAPGLHASRSYTDFGVGLGAEARYRLPHGFSLEFDGVFPLPISHTAQVANVTGRVAYSFLQSSPVRPTVFLGLGGRWINFKDSQTLPNHTSVSSGPLLTFGVAVDF